MLTVSRVAKSYGANDLFRDVSFQLVPGRRVALVGDNGVGKTTLLEIVVGLEEPDSGNVTHAGQVSIGYLPQDVTVRPLHGARRVGARGRGPPGAGRTRLRPE